MASRREILTGAALAATGAVVGAAGTLGTGAIIGSVTANDPVKPLYTSTASTIHDGRRTAPVNRDVRVHWGVHTSKKLIALTFDDGPMPQWTPEVLSILDDHGIPATFFMVGQRAVAHQDLIKNRLARHEVGNHTWTHHDLAKAEYAVARAEIQKTHDVLSRIAGQEPVLLRPPYGHIAGSTLLAAADLGYSVVLWNLQMLESDFSSKPRGLVDYIVTEATPGTILLAHDTGADERLVAIRNLPAMIDGLHQRGFEFVTVSQLLARA